MHQRETSLQVPRHAGHRCPDSALCAGNSAPDSVLGARPALTHGRGKSWISKQNDPDHKPSHPLLNF